MSEWVSAYLWLPPEVENLESYTQRKRETIERFCRSEGWVLERYISDPDTGRLLERRALKGLLSQMDKEGILLLESLCDLGRRFHDVYQLLEWFRQDMHSRRLVAIKEDFQVFSGQSLFSQLRHIPQLQTPLTPSRRSVRRSEFSRYRGGACPYGYGISAENQYEVLPSEAQVVELIYAWRLKGFSLRQIALRLTQKGFKTKRGGRWQANTIKTILENVFYTGVYQTHHSSIEHHHPAIISKSLFYQINHPESFDDIAL